MHLKTVFAFTALIAAVLMGSDSTSGQQRQWWHKLYHHRIGINFRAPAAS